MVNIFAAVIFLLLSFPLQLALAQANPKGVKIYSGFVHHYGAQSNDSLWHKLFGKRSHKIGENIPDRQCSIEFDSPIPFSTPSVSALPDHLSYYIKFNNAPHAIDISINGKDPFEKFIIKIFNNDDDEYPIDPNAEGSQTAMGDEHQIRDPYLIFLILSHNINHLEIVNASGNEEYKYILDKFEVRDNP